MDLFFQLLPLLFWWVVSVIPTITICQRIGKTRWRASVMILPFFGIVVFLYVIAYSRWKVRPTPEQIGDAFR